jgi:imidazolonepropionase-like amidohydrolase
MSALLLTVLFLLAPVGTGEPPLALVGGQVLPGAGADVLEAATVLIRDGQVVAVGTDLRIPEDARIVDASGFTLVPSFVDAAHAGGLEFPEHDPDPGRPKDDGRDVFAGMLETNRRGIAPERQAWRALESTEMDGDGHREAGFGALLAAPSGMLLSGTGAWLLPNGRPAREALLGTTAAQFASITWRSRPEDYEGSDYPATLMGVMAHLRQVLLDARNHSELLARFSEGRSSRRPPQDPTLAALQPLLAGVIPLVIRADEEEDIRLALGLAVDFPELRLVIAGGSEAWELAEQLAAAKVPVILDLDFAEEPDGPEEKSTEEAGDEADSDVSDEPDDASSGEAAEAESDDADKEQEPAALQKPGPFDPGVPTRLRDDRHRRWVERIAGVALLIDAGVPVAFGSFDRSAKDLRDSVVIAIDKGGLTSDVALAVLIDGAAKVFSEAPATGQLSPGRLACLTGWRGEPIDEDAEVAFAVVDGRFFDYRDDLDPEADDEADDESDDAESDDDKKGESEPEEGEVTKDEGKKKKKKGDKAGRKKSESSATDSPAVTPYQRALATAQRDAEPSVQWPVELDVDREPSFRTGGDVLITNATILTCDDRDGTLTGFDMLVRKGRIVALQAGMRAVEGVRTVDGTGLFLLPGVIDCHAHVGIRGGINEWTRVVTPEVSIEDEVDPDDVNLYRALAGGTTAGRLLHGSANAIGGRHEVIKFRWGSSAPEMLLEGAPRGVKFALGENPRQANWGEGGRFPSTRMGVEVVLRRAFEAAVRYREEWARFDADTAADRDPDPPRRDLRLEALVGILEGQIDVHSHCYRAHEILMLMGIAEEFGFTIATFQHVLEGYKVAAEIAAHQETGGRGASTFIDWWGFKFEAYDAIPYNPAIVHEAGALMSINSDSGDHIRRLHLEAAKAVKYGGVPELEALKMVTLNPAIQLGIERDVGSIRVGKDADFSLFSGHPFDVTSRCLMTFVDGELVFEAPNDTYAAWAAEVDRRITAGLAARSGELPRPAPEGREPLTPEALQLLSRPVQGTRSPSTPARPAAQSIALIGGRVHTMSRSDGTLVTHDPGLVLMRSGLIEEVRAGEADIAALQAAGYSVRDVSGLDVWPGMIDGGSGVGLGEISAVKQSMDTREVGGDQVDIRASTAWHPASDQIPVARVNGITSALTVPSGSGIAGQSALMALEGWTVSDALVRDGLALHVGVPRVSRDTKQELTEELVGCMGGGSVLRLTAAEGTPGEGRKKGSKKEKEKPLEDRVQDAWKHLDEMFDDAREYARVSAIQRADGGSGVQFDPRLEALAPFAVGAAPVIFAADRATQIADALDFADTHGLWAIISGGREAWKVADRLALADVPVLLGPVLAMPMGRNEPYDSPFACAGLLERAGVRFGFRSGSAWNVRNLPYNAGMAVAYGLDEQAALYALTAGAADVLGLTDTLGQLAPGLRADVVVSDGSLLQITTRVHSVFIGGRDVGLESKHTRLYETYRDHLHDPGRPSK